MEINWLITFIAALVPMVMGYIWYNPKVFGNAWMSSAGLSMESMKGMNMGMTLGLSFLFSFMVAFILHPIVIHQYGLFSLLQNQPGMNETPITNPDWQLLMPKYADNFRTFKHGAFHGVIAGLFFLLPITATSALYERRGFKYIAITVGYWVVNLAIMGGLLSQYK
ncbi:MAG: DUF1761 domain-containing protein [Saprospiraceae bacterium]